MKKRTKQAAKGSSSIKSRISIAWKNLLIFLVLFAVSFLLFNLSSSDLFINFFAVLSMILGFVAFTFLVVLIVLVLLRSPRR